MPSYWKEQNKLTKRFKQCLKRIFTIADQDNDQLLNDDELTMLQDYCFGKIPTKIDEKATIEQLKYEIQRRTFDGIKIIRDNKGEMTTALTYQGFECLFELYLNKGKYETIYTTLERFSYNRKLELCVPNAPEGKNKFFSFSFSFKFLFKRRSNPFLSNVDSSYH